MALNPNTWRVTSEADLDGTPYQKQQAVTGRITVVQDPLGQRGNVVKLYRDTGDALVNSGRRVEIARDVFQSEYAFGTGGGWYYTSYLLGPEWTAAVESGALDYESDLSAIIKQFHPRNADGFVHPIWAIQVNQYGVRLLKNAIDDSASHTVIASWPIDNDWHDVVFGIHWVSDTQGRFMFFLDHQLIYAESAPQIYAGAAAGAWFSEGIYLPGSERAVDRLTIYTQGYTQGYPGTDYRTVVGRNAEHTREIAEDRNVRRFG